nr:YfhO family protein [Candidatus Levybacteria bacterium]
MRIIKRFWPVVLIFAVWFIFASPYFLKNKVPFSSTYLVNFFAPWSAYPGFSSPVKNNAMPDVISQIVPWKNFTIDSFKNFQIPLWNSYSFSGTPHLANYQSAVLSPFNLIFFILPFINAWSLLVLLQPLLAGLFMYLFLKSLKSSSEASVIGSLSFMFCGFIVTWMAYATLAFAILFLPLSLFAIEKYYQTQENKFLILFSFTFPLSFFSGHFQISLYFLLFVISYVVFKFFQTKNKLNTSYLILYTILGLLLSLPQLLPSIELYTQSLRSAIFQKTEVIPWSYLVTFIAPDFFGNPVTRNDWFGHYAEWNAYVGIISLMFSIYSFLGKRKKEIIFFGIMSLVTLCLSFQTPLLDLLIALKIPVLSTSAVGRIIVLFSFSASVLAALGFEKLIEDIKEKKNKYILSWLLGFFIIFLSLWLIVFLKLFLSVDKILISKQNLILPSILFTVSALTILSGLLLRFKHSSYILNLISLILIIIVAFDLLRFAGKWMPFESKNLMYPNVLVTSQFSKIPKSDRVLGNLGGEATTYYGLSSLEGYDALYIKRYGEFIASLSNGKLQESARSVVSFPKNGLYTLKTINLLGVKYIIHKTADGRSSWTFPFWTYKDGIFPRIYNDGVYEVFENKNVFPRAFLVGKYIVQKNQQKILNTMFSKNFNLRKEIVLEEDLNKKLDGVSGSAKIISYTANKIKIKTNSSRNSLLFLSDIYYSGWEALVDGKNAKIYRADYTFRAVYLPKGNHAVEFIYNPLSFRLGLISACLGLFALVGFSLRRKIT